MPVSGHERVLVRPRGGVARVEIVPASLFEGAGVDPATGRIASFEASGALARMVFCEDRAEYSETRAGFEPMNPLVKHTLKMEFPAGEAARRTARELALHSGEGFVAIVTTASGEKLIAGWSERFGTGYPLRVTAIDSSTSRLPADLPTLDVTLESVDADRSPTLT